jgi:hypothetical protein
MGEMKRAITREERTRSMENQTRAADRFASTLVIAASIIAAVRLAREGRGSALDAPEMNEGEQAYRAWLEKASDAVNCSPTGAAAPLFI